MTTEQSCTMVNAQKENDEITSLVDNLQTSIPQNALPDDVLDSFSSLLDTDDAVMVQSSPDSKSVRGVTDSIANDDDDGKTMLFSSYSGETKQAPKAQNPQSKIGQILQSLSEDGGENTPYDFTPSAPKKAEGASSIQPKKVGPTLLASAIGLQKTKPKSVLPILLFLLLGMCGAGAFFLFQTSVPKESPVMTTEPVVEDVQIVEAPTSTVAETTPEEEPVPDALPLTTSETANEGTQIAEAPTQAVEQESVHPEATLELIPRIWADANVYHEGERFTVHISTNQRCYGVVIFVSNTGQIVRLLPNATRQMTVFNADSEYVVPNNSDPFILEIAPPFGNDRVLFYAASEALGTVNWVDVGGGLAVFEGTLEQFTASIFAIKAQGDAPVQKSVATWDITTQP